MKELHPKVGELTTGTKRNPISAIGTKRMSTLSGLSRFKKVECITN